MDGNKDIIHKERKFYTPSLCDATLSSDTPSEDEDKLRRKLVDEFVDVSEKMKVYLRIRASRLNERNKNCIEIIDKSTVIMHPPHKPSFTKTHSQDTSKLSQKFIFTEVCGPDIGQEEFFNITMSDTIKQFNDGQNCLIFAYGITNSGKSYTIQGKPSQPGLIPRTLSIIFNNIQGYQMKSPLFKPNYSSITCLSDKQQKEELLTKELLLGVIDNELTDDDSELSCSYSRSASLQSSNMSNDATNKYNSLKSQDNLSVVHCEESDSSDHKKTVYLIWVSFVEVYNEHVFDLLMPSTGSYRTKLSLVQDKNGNASVKGLREIFVTSAKEAYEILKFGQKNLRIASTKLNHQSSRSHCIFNIKMVKIDDIENPNEARINKLSFCDLAGSERTSKTQNIGERLKEAGNINTSLLVLGRCIEILRQNQVHKEKKVIPYRDSKLTRIFQSVFTGKGQALMIVNVHQCSSLFDETLNVMKFSAIAKQVMTMDVINTSSFTSRIMDCLTEIWVRNSSSWATFNKGRARKSSSFTIDETVEEEEDEDQDGNDNQHQKLYHELEQLVKDLEKQLLEAKMANALMESQIREEVSKEYAEHMNKIEKAYKEQLRKVQQNVDDFLKEEIDIVCKMYNDSEGSEDDDEYEEEEEDEEAEELSKENETSMVVSSKFQETHKEEPEDEDKCAKLTNQIRAMKNEIRKSRESRNSLLLENEKLKESLKEEKHVELTAMKSEITDIKTFRDNLILENERLKAEYSNEVKQAHDKNSEILKLKEDMKNLEIQLSKKNYDQDDVILKLKENVKNLEIQLTEKNKKVVEQGDVILKAGEIFSEKESEVIKLDSIIKCIKEQSDLQKAEIAMLSENLKKTQMLLESTNKSINEKEIENQKLKEELKCLQELRCPATPKKLNADVRINEIQVKLEEALKEKSECQNSLDNLKKELEETRLNNMKEKAEIKLSCAQNISAYSELKDKLSHKESELEETKKKCENNEVMLEEKMKIIEELKNEIINYQLQISEGETLQESLKTEKDRCQIILSEATKQLKKMLYSKEDDVVPLMKEMYKKWNEINNLAVFLEQRLYVMGESHHSAKESYNSQIKILTEEIHNLKVENAENTLHAELVKKLQNEITELKNERERYFEECRPLKEQNEIISKLEVDIKKKEEECNSILYDLQINKCRYEDVCNAIEKIEEKLKLDKETDKIEDDTDRMSNFLNNFDKFYKKYELLKEECEQEQKEVENLKGSIEKMHIKHAKQEDELKMSVLKLEESLKQKENEYNEHIIEYEKMREMISEDYKQKEVECAELEIKIQAINEKYLDEIQQKDAKINNLIAELELAKTKLVSNFSEVEKSHKEERCTEDAVNINKADSIDNSEKNGWEKKYEELHHKFKSTKKALKKKKSEITELKTKLSSLEEVSEKMDSEKELIISKLESDVKQIEDKYNRNLHELELMKSELEEKTKEIVIISHKNEILQEKMKDLDELENFKTKEVEYAKLMEDLQQKCNKLSEQIQEYDKQMETSNSKISSLEEMHKKYEEEKCILVEKLLSSKNNLIEKTKAYSELMKELQDTKLKLKQNDSQVEWLQNQQNEHLKEKEILNVNINQLRKQLEEYRELEEAKFEKCEKEKEELKEKLNYIQQEFDDDKDNFEKESKLANEEKERLKRENEKLKEEMEEYKKNQNFTQTDVKGSEETFKVPEKPAEMNEEEKNDNNNRRSARPRRRKLLEYYCNSSESSFDTKENSAETVTSKPRRTRKKVAKNDSSSEEEYPPVRRKRQSQRRAKNSTDTENKPPQPPVKQVEMKSPLKKISSFIRDKSPVFDAMTQSVLNIFSRSTDNSESQQQTRRRRPLFLASNHLCAISPVKAEEKEANSLHTVVTRQLRTRNQRKNYAM